MKSFTLSMAALAGLATIAACNNTDPGAFCGDGTRDSNEQCDDGNDVAGDGCDAECLVEIAEGCGDGVIANQEECDDEGESAECDVDCTLAACGDAMRNVALGEGCDDGNVENGDGCSDDCNLELSPFCGDGNVGADETCDDGGETANCDDDCTPVECGDSNINEAADETCDDGNTVGGDTCSSTCQTEGMACGIEPLTCNSMVNVNQTTPGSTNVIPGYSCLVDQIKTGPEWIFEFVAPSTGPAGVYLEGTSALDVIVLEAETDCSLGECLASGQAGANFNTTAGTKYLIIVDTDPGPAVPFQVGMFCE